jgi:hypothetical protein
MESVGGSNHVIKLRSSAAGKGDKPRPLTSTPDQYAASYCRIFGHQPRTSGACRNCGQLITQKA